jgi:nucleotide-binding universal stress UspA family protein
MADGLVVIGYDGSPSADHAVREAGRVLGSRPALIVVVWEAGVAYESMAVATIPAVPVDLRAAAAADEAVFEGARRTAARGVEVATEAGLRAEGLAVSDEGTVGSTLAAIAREREAEIVVVGARGLGGLQKLLLGSTSREVLEAARRPVLVIHQAEE